MRARRLELKLSQAAVGKILGIATTTVVHWEQGTHPIRMCTIYPAIFKFLGYIPDFLIEEDAQLQASNFRKWIRFRRQLKGITAIVFAEMLGVTLLSLRQWETLKEDPSPNQKNQIMKILGSMASILP